MDIAQNVKPEEQQQQNQNKPNRQGDTLPKSKTNHQRTIDE